jgi:glutamate 5-kinase
MKKLNSDYSYSSKRCVIKIGSSVLTENGRGIESSFLASWVAGIHFLQNNGW